MYTAQIFYKHRLKSILFCKNLYYHTFSSSIRQVEKGRGETAAVWYSLLLTEGLAVGALVLGRILLMSAHHDMVQRAIVCGIAVIGTLLNGAGNALIGIVVHVFSSF